MKTVSCNTKTEPAKRASRIVLGESLDITGACSLHAKLERCAARRANVNLNAGKVAIIDTTALQLLLAFIRKVRDNGNRVTWQSPSETVLKTAELTGLSVDLGLPQAGA